MENPIPQPPSTFLIGNVRDVNPDCFIGSLQRLRKLYGPIFSLDIFQDHIIVVSNQEIVNYLCDESNFVILRNSDPVNTVMASLS